MLNQKGLASYDIRAIAIIGFLIRIVLVVVNLTVVTLPQGGGDALTLERNAWAASEMGREVLSYYLTSNSEFIVLPGSLIYDAVGRAPFVLGLVMALLGVGVIVLVYRAVLELWGNHRVAAMAAWATALFPQLALHSALFLREMPVSFCVAAAALGAIRYVKYHRLEHAAAFVGWIFVGSLFHSGVVVALPAFAVGLVLARGRQGTPQARSLAASVGLVVLLAAVVYGMGTTGVGLGKFGESLDDTLETFETREARATEGGAAFPEWMRIRGGVSDAWKAPIRFVALLFAPLVPFMVRSAGHLIGLLDAALYVWMMVLLYRHRALFSRRREYTVLLVVAMALFLVYALGVSNFGTAIRHRAKVAPLLLILAAGLPELRRAFAASTQRMRREGPPTRPQPRPSLV